MRQEHYSDSEIKHYMSTSQVMKLMITVYSMSISLLRKMLNASQNYINEIVAYTFVDVCEIHQFLSGIKKMHTRENWFLFLPHGVQGGDVTESMVTTRSPCCGWYNMMCAVKRRRFMELFSSKIESVSLRKCPYDHWLTNKAYLSAITVTNISPSFSHKMAAKINWHRYGTKLRYCRPMDRCQTPSPVGAVPWSVSLSKR